MRTLSHMRVHMQRVATTTRHAHTHTHPHTHTHMCMQAWSPHALPCTSAQTHAQCKCIVNHKRVACRFTRNAMRSAMQSATTQCTKCECNVQEHEAGVQILLLGNSSSASRWGKDKHNYEDHSKYKWSLLPVWESGGWE